MTWENIGGYSIPAIVMGGIGWLVKLRLEHKMKADFDTKIEKLKSELAEGAAERQVRFAQVYGETVKAMQDFHHQLLQCDRQTTEAMEEEVFEDEAWEEVEKQEKVLDELWAKNGLYFPTECEESIANAIVMRRELVRLVGRYFDNRKKDMNLAYQTKMQYAGKRDEFIVLVATIATNFRRYMGVELKPATDKKP